MKLEDFLAHANSGKRIVDPSEELEYSSYLTQEALKVTMELNNAYHTPEEVQDLFAKLTGSEVNRSLALVPPFYTDCGKISMLARTCSLILATPSRTRAESILATGL